MYPYQSQVSISVYSTYKPKFNTFKYKPIN